MPPVARDRLVPCAPLIVVGLRPAVPTGSVDGEGRSRPDELGLYVDGGVSHGIFPSEWVCSRLRARWRPDDGGGRPAARLRARHGRLRQAAGRTRTMLTGWGR